MPGPCNLCGCRRGARRGDAWNCADCGWRYGDTWDADLPVPRVEVVYYLRYRDRVKIGTSAGPRRRLASIRHEELLAFECGGRTLERERHRQFAEIREGGEWFTFTAELREHTATLRGRGEPWTLYARWLSEALRQVGHGT